MTTKTYVNQFNSFASKLQYTLSQSAIWLWQPPNSIEITHLLGDINNRETIEGCIFSVASNPRWQHGFESRCGEHRPNHLAMQRTIINNYSLYQTPSLRIPIYFIGVRNGIPRSSWIRRGVSKKKKTRGSKVSHEQVSWRSETRRVEARSEGETSGSDPHLAKWRSCEIALSHG